jgi:two-component system KDP operon response regulator KdpE
MKVLIVDDDPDIVEAVGICFALRWPDAQVVDAPDAETALQRFSEENPDVVILDLGLPDRNGFEVCAKIRETSNVPIVMLTARGDEMNKVRGLEMGADDYVTKPFSHLELLARIKAVLRRAATGPLGGAEPPFEKGAIKFDFGAHRVFYGGQHVALTPTEYNLLYHLTKNYPNVVPHRTLLAKVWGKEYAEETDYLKVHVQRIRSKFSAVAPGADPISNERGIGYRLQVENGA